MMEGKEELQSFNVVSNDNNSIIPTTTTRRECIMLLIGFILAIVSLQLYEIGISTVTSISSGSSLALEDTSNSSTELLILSADIVPKSKLPIEEYTTNTTEDQQQGLETFEVIQLNNNNISLVQISIKRASLSSATVYSVTIQSYDKYTSSAYFLGSTTTSLDEHVLLQYEWQPRFPGNYEVLVHKIVQEKWSRNSNTLSTSTLIHPSPFHISIDRLKENSSTEHRSTNLLPCQLGDRHVFSKWDGDWIGPSLQQPENPNILRTGWSFIPSNEMNCTIETYSQDDIYDISEKKSIVILGSSIDRGIFLSLVDILLSIEEKVHFEKSVVGKCWGQAVIRKGNLKLMYQDFRTIRFGVPGKDNDNYYECNNDKVAVESPREFVNNATLFWEDLFHERRSWPSVVYMRTAHFIHAQNLVKKIPKAWTGTLYLVDFQLSARQAGLVDQESYETYLKGLKSKIHRLGDDDRIRWLDGIGISKEMRIYSEFTNQVAASQHFHRFCTNDNPQMSVCSNITEMLGQVLLGTAVGPKAALQRSTIRKEHDLIFCHACPASLVPFHIIPRPNLTCIRGPFKEMKLNEIIPYTQRDCPKQCLEQQPNSTFRSQSDVVQQRYCSSDKSETLLLSSSTPIINSNVDDLNDLQQALDSMWGSKETNSSNNITCKWSPGQNDECITHISKLIEPSAQRRWLLFGDSTVFRLFNSSSLSDVLVHSPLGKIHDQQCYRDSQLECHRKKGSRCKLNDLFGLPYRDNWVPPHNSGLNFIGPHKYGASNPYCTDCSGCFSDFLQCALKGNVSSYDSCGFVYGGYIHMEYARDIEIQTPEFLTTQENLAAYISRVWNTRDLIQEWRRPVCVMSVGLHDMTIKNISTWSYVHNVKSMLDKFTPVCDHIIWLGNISPKTSSSNDNSTYKQTIPLTKSWDRAVMEMIESETKFTHKISFIDVHESSLTYPHADYIHMTRDWYEKLASGLFLPLIRLSST